MMKAMAAWGPGVLLLLSMLLRRPAGAQEGTPSSAAQGPAALFEKQCYSCHNIGGGDKKGPDLMGLLQRRERRWLRRYLLSPKAMKQAGDATAVELFKKYAPEEMPDQMLSADQIDQLLEMIDRLSAQKKTFVPQSGKLARPPRPQDIPAGYRLFTGQKKLTRGGPACIACHSVAGLGGLEGGTLGPDLTQANVRYTDIELASILKAPAFPTMSQLLANRELTDEEVVQLFAYLQSAKARLPNPARTSIQILVGSVAGMLVLLGWMHLAWRGRLRGVRRHLEPGA